MHNANNSLLALATLTTLSFIIAILWTPLLTKVLYRYRLGKPTRNTPDTPIFTAMHEQKAGTPTMGGVLIWVTALVLALVPWFFDRVVHIQFFHRFNFLTRAETLLPLGALIAASVVGLLDDFFNIKKIGSREGGLRVRQRLIIYTLIAIIGGIWFVTKLDWTTLHVPFIGNYDIGWWYFPIFVFVIVATSHSVNVTDGLDGLAGGVMLAMFVAFGAIAYVQGHYFLTTLCGVVIGSLLAFLWFNIPPARFYMGDTGAMGLGTLLGVVTMLTNTALLLPIIGLLLVVESGSVLLQISSKKLRHGKKVFLSAPVHHHFQAKGWPESKVVMRFWIISAVSAAVGFILFLTDLKLR